MPKSPKLMGGRRVDWVVSFFLENMAVPDLSIIITILPLTSAANKAGQTLPPSLGFIVTRCIVISFDFYTEVT